MERVDLLPGAECVRAEPLPPQVCRRKEDPCGGGRETGMEWHPGRHPTVLRTQPALPTPHAGSQGHKDPNFLLYVSTSAGSPRPRTASDVLESERG